MELIPLLNVGFHQLVFGAGVEGFRTLKRGVYRTAYSAGSTREISPIFSRKTSGHPLNVLLGDLLGFLQPSKDSEFRAD